jgi:hypothetical protein
MSRLAVLLVTFAAVAGCASASHQPMRIDASSAAAFNASVQSFKAALPVQRRTFFVIALQDIWQTVNAEAEPASSRADLDKAFLALLDGHSYREIIDLADAKPPTTRELYARAYPAQQFRAPAGSMSPQPMFSDPHLYNLSGAPVGMPQYNTSCGTVCSR